MTNVITDANIGSGATAVAEAVIQTLSASNFPTNARIRGHLLVTGNASASTITLRVRAGSLTGAQLYTSGAVNLAAAVVDSIPFEVKDTTSLGTAPGLGIPAENATWVLTAVVSLAGTFNGGYMAVETLP